MSTDLTIHQPAPLAERKEYAETVAQSNLLPRAFQGRPADVLVAVEYGRALGIEPIVALSEINVISGTPSLSASMMAALTRQAGHKLRVDGNAEAATCVIIRSDDPDHEHTATWDVKKAKDAGLWGKGHWAKDPATMLRWRAISECVRFACSEVLGGLKYTPEEVREFTSNRPEPVQVRASARASGNARLAQAIAPQPAPEPEPEVVDAEVEETTEAAESAAGGPARMFSLLIGAGLDEPAAALEFISNIVDHEVTHSSELTDDEVQMVISHLTD